MRLIGSLYIAVPLLLAIATVLAWGTIYETRFGTAAVQEAVYRAWWFQTLLGFLAVNLAIAAARRWPWRRDHTPFVLAHLGIILILIGGIVGGRFGIDGQLIIAEGDTARWLELPGNVLVVHEPNPGTHHVLPMRFAASADQTPHALFRVPLDAGEARVVVDRYYPDAIRQEHVMDDGPSSNPAIQFRLWHDEQEAELWLFARDPERFGLGWGEAHVLFLEPATEAQRAQLLGVSTDDASPPRGVVSVRLPGDTQGRDVPVPERMGEPVALGDSGYTVTFRDYFPDFSITEQGIVSRSEAPNNPAIAFVLEGPEGTDAHLLFALHPDFPVLHGRSQRIAADVSYTHPAAGGLPPNAIALLREPSGGFTAVLSGPAGERQVVPAIETGTRYRHPWLAYEFSVEQLYARARVLQTFTNRSHEVKMEAIHVMIERGGHTAESWLALRESADLTLGEKPLVVEYRPDQRALPFTVKLLDFRKIDYPGTQMAAGFESDVEVADAQRGLILVRKISMNNPLRYRGYSLFQSSYVPGPVETTILSARNDPGTPAVYAGFLIVIAGVIWMFVSRSRRKSTP